MKNRRNITGWMIFEACLIIALGVVIIIQADWFGVSEKNIEKDMRKAMQVEEDWQTVEAGDENLYAVLAYSPEKENYTYAVYLNRKGFSFGYFFREGGEAPYIEQGVQKIIYEDYGEALLSMNQQNISRIVIDNGQEQQVISVDSGKPFVTVLPLNSGEVTFWNENGEQIQDIYYDRYTG